MTGPAPDQTGGAPGAEELLAISDLRVSFGGLPVLEGVSLGVPRGAVVALVGESGSGKSVLARSVLGLAGAGSVTGGRIVFDGRDLARASERELRGLRGGPLSLMVQDAQSALNPVYRIGSQLIETLALRRPRFSADRPFWRPWAGRARRADMKAEAAALLAEAGLGDPERCLAAFPHQLSGGMRQRVMLAMALAGRPDLLIADEPTTALDVVTQKRILGRLVDSARQRGSAVLLISHDLQLVGELADHLAVMYAGRIMEAGPAAAALARPANPYTRDLLAAAPRRDTPKGSLRPIPGEPPAPWERGRGCPYLGRCLEAGSDCLEPPAEKDIGPRWRARCHRPLRADQTSARPEAGPRPAAGTGRTEGRATGRPADQPAVPAPFLAA